MLDEMTRRQKLWRRTTQVPLFIEFTYELVSSVPILFALYLHSDRVLFGFLEYCFADLGHLIELSLRSTNSIFKLLRARR